MYAWLRRLRGWQRLCDVMIIPAWFNQKIVNADMWKLKILRSFSFVHYALIIFIEIIHISIMKLWLFMQKNDGLYNRACGYDNERYPYRWQSHNFVIVIVRYANDSILNFIFIFVNCAKICVTLQWRHNEREGVSIHHLHECLFNRLFRHRAKKISKLRVTGLCAGNSPVAGEFTAQRASNAENVSLWWRHH